MGTDSLEVGTTGGGILAGEAEVEAREIVPGALPFRASQVAGTRDATCLEDSGLAGSELKAISMAFAMPTFAPNTGPVSGVSCALAGDIGPTWSASSSWKS